MQIGSLGDLGPSGRRIAHVATLNSSLPDPLESVNQNIPISLRRTTLEKMFRIFLDEVKLKRAIPDSPSNEKEPGACIYTFPFMEMAYERERKTASRCMKKTSYVAEMASHLLFLKRQAIPKWIKENCGHESGKENKSTTEKDTAPANSIPVASFAAPQPPPSKIEVLLGMPRRFSEIQMYLLSSEQAAKVGIPSKDYRFSYRISSETSIASDPVACERCEIEFIPSNYYKSSSPSSCAYHEGKLRWPPANAENSNRGMRKNNTKRWSCCEGDRYSTACSLAQLHVYRIPAIADFEMGASPAFSDAKVDLSRSVVTHSGLSLARISIVGWDSQSVLLDLLVKSKDQVVDYNTAFSGITEGTFNGQNKDGPPIVSFEEAQLRVVDLLSCSERVVLVGHSIENDLHAVAHDLIIDTSVLFPHHLGPNYRYGLKGLAERYLQEKIQANIGHSSLEDARAALDIFKFKLALDRGLIAITQ
ncbi:hypothetical protein DI09_10p290 [Mitosporidium daphniae]|uniref:Exonuclease domain-containing protein n=1 Tax=Mitosporidium daphniae TaxID=1485682 RepID=A0A098VVZ9_9MICR|nr:uncharacterized protein DI09_10p290 [Mitosporidium daphniae]KGG53132.1 hypothetical protein DI09_10p290 [Mitosporidium daphniae]|eukprot:XP_013239559.1 uncharacterized protein DI09_10p290 [Mitosporidium daphniae]